MGLVLNPFLSTLKRQVNVMMRSPKCDLEKHSKGLTGALEAYPEERDVCGLSLLCFPRFLQVENYKPAFSGQSYFLLNLNDPCKLGLL